MAATEAGDGGLLSIAHEATDIANEIEKIADGRQSAAALLAIGMVLGVFASRAARPDIDGVLELVGKAAKGQFDRIRDRARKQNGDTNHSTQPMLPIPVSAAQQVANLYGYDQVIIIARRVGKDPEPNGEHVTTYGVNDKHRNIAARIGDFLKFKIFGWKEEESHEDFRVRDRTRIRDEAIEAAAILCDDSAMEADHLRAQVPQDDDESNVRLHASRTSWINTARSLAAQIRALKSARRATS